LKHSRQGSLLPRGSSDAPSPGRRPPVALATTGVQTVAFEVKETGWRPQRGKFTKFSSPRFPSHASKKKTRMSAGQLELPQIRSRPPLDVWVAIVQHTNLTGTSKALARARVAVLATGLRRRVTVLFRVFCAGKIFVTAGSLLVPSLTGLDAQRARPEATFWFIWCLSLLVGTTNAFLSLFGVDRKYFLLKDQLARLEAEAWLFLSLSGRYKGLGAHEELFASFMEKCEAILDSTCHVRDGHSRKTPQPSTAAPPTVPPSVVACPPDDPPAKESHGEQRVV